MSVTGITAQAKNLSMGAEMMRRIRIISGVICLKHKIAVAGNKLGAASGDDLDDFEELKKGLLFDLRCALDEVESL